MTNAQQEIIDDAIKRGDELIELIKQINNDLKVINELGKEITNGS